MEKIATPIRHWGSILPLLNSRCKSTRIVTRFMITRQTTVFGTRKFTLLSTGNTVFYLGKICIVFALMISRSARVGCKDSIVYAPPFFKSFIDKRHRAGTEPFNLRRKCISNPIYCYKARHRTVQNLCFLVSPTTIIRFIITIRINPINRVFRRRLFAHVTEKVYKPSLRVIPSIADLYASTTIVFILLMFWVVTTFAHRAPAIILWFIYGLAAMAIVTVHFPIHIHKYIITNLTGVNNEY